MTPQQKDFEVWAEADFNLIKTDTGNYISGYTLRAWQAWKAGQARQAIADKKMPMTEQQSISFLNEWATTSRSLKLISFIRAIESHHNIGVNP